MLLSTVKVVPACVIAASVHNLSDQTTYLQANTAFVVAWVRSTLVFSLQTFIQTNIAHWTVERFVFVDTAEVKRISVKERGTHLLGMGWEKGWWWWRFVSCKQCVYTHRHIPHFSQWYGVFSIPVKCLHNGQKYSENLVLQLLHVWLSSFIWNMK